MKKKVVITGLGLVTPLGVDLEENWRKALAGISGISKLSLPGANGCAIQAVGAVSEKDWQKITEALPEATLSEGERRTLFALWAAKAALEDSGLISLQEKSERWGVTLAAGLGIYSLEDIHRWLLRDGSFDLMRFGREWSEVSRESMVRNHSHRAASMIAMKFSLSGLNCTVTSACASATQAIGIGFRAIQRGDADVILAGGSDSMINPLGIVGFVLLQAAAASVDSGGACRPFDRKRSGLVIGEGAGVAILEEESHALKRGARIYGEVSGYGSSMDSYQVTAPHPEGLGAVLCMKNALKDANLEPAAIDYINAHGTGTKLNDATETLAIKKVFKECAQRIAISSSKSLIGHLMAAAGAPEFVYTALTVYRDEIHPTINLSNPDPNCDLDYVPNRMRSRRVGAALSNSFGFGGQNASVVVKKYLV